jgi:hypothetical protein
MPTNRRCVRTGASADITYSFVARVLIAALLAGYGMIEDHLLFMIGGLVFMPFMPIVLAIGFGALTQQWRLAAHALGAFAAATLLIMFGGVVVASLAEPPILFDGFASPVIGISFSLAVGIAGALGIADDTGHRQFVGLAAASQSCSRGPIFACVRQVGLACCCLTVTRTGRYAGHPARRTN